ncbi:MAG: 6-bladed beta-propeller, partial [Candidatus Aminicenantales bacterium]
MKKNNAVIMVCLILLFCLTACKEKIQKAKVETIEGVTYIHNPVTPLHPNKSFTFEEEFTYKDIDETGEIRLFKPGRFAVDFGGKVYIEDESDMAVKVLDQAGKFLCAIGRRGEGPGEFASVGYIFPLPDGRLLVTDPWARRTSFFGPEGQFLSSFAWKKLFQRIYLATDSSCTLEEGVYPEESRGLWIKTIDFLGEELITFGNFKLPEFKTFHEEGGMTLLPVPWSPASVFAGDQTRQRLYHCPSDKYEIEVYDRQGKLIRKIDRSYERVPVTSEDISEYLSRFNDRPESQLAQYYQ